MTLRQLGSEFRLQRVRREQRHREPSDVFHHLIFAAASFGPALGRPSGEQGQDDERDENACDAIGRQQFEERMAHEQPEIDRQQAQLHQQVPWRCRDRPTG